MANKTLRFPKKYDANLSYIKFENFKWEFPRANLTQTQIAGYQENKKNKEIPEIILYAPGDFNENIQSTWSLQNVIGGPLGGTGWIGDFIRPMYNMFSQGIAAAAGDNIANTYNAKFGSGNASYPSDLLIFNGTEPITLTFNYTFIPFDQDESREISRIVNIFKREVLPKVGRWGDGFGKLNFPNIWNITFLSTSKGSTEEPSVLGVRGMGLEEQNIYREMALIGVNVSYQSSDTSLLTYDDGFPLHTKLQLQFKSIRKHRIQTDSNMYLYDEGV